MKKGDAVRWASDGMTGTVVDVCTDGTSVQIEWAEGFPQDTSGWTLWTPRGWIDSGLIVRVNGHEKPEPAQAPDLFARAFQLAFEV